jgi:hypothetical protein
MIYKDLQRVPRGRCSGGFRLRLTGGCTHGPDAAPPGRNVADPLPVGTRVAAAGVPRVQCEGEGFRGNRVKVVYARANNVPDRYAAVVDSIRQWAIDADKIVRDSAGETDGERHLSYVHDADCVIDVANVTMDPSADDSFDGTIGDLMGRGYTRTDRKYLVFVDASVYCGIGEVEDDDSDSTANLNNGGPHFSRVDTGCWSGEVAAHELMHNLGGVQMSAPHSTGGWHCTDDYDVMCYSDEPNFPTITTTCADWAHERLFDCNHDDYFHTGPAPGSYLDTHWNAADNQFLNRAPQSAWGYVWANDPTAASYTPAPQYQRNSTNAVNRIVRTATGQYAVTFRNLGVIGGTVNVTGYGTGSEYCKVTRWRRSPAALSDLEAFIGCFTTAGLPVDARFAATFARPGSNLGARFAYVWADEPGNPSYVPNSRYQYNNFRLTNEITRSATGRYRVRLPGLGAPGGIAKVSAYGSGTETCKAAGWFRTAAVEFVDIACHTAAGAPVDARFTMTFHDADGPFGVQTDTGSERAYVLTDQPSAASSTPGGQFNSSGASNTVARSAAGVYAVRLPGLAVPRGHVQVTAWSDTADSMRCKVASWTFTGSDETVNVRCFDVTGAAADARFAMTFVD